MSKLRPRFRNLGTWVLLLSRSQRVLLGSFHTDYTATASAIRGAIFRGFSSLCISQREQESLEGPVNSSEQDAEYKRYQTLLSIIITISMPQPLYWETRKEAMIIDIWKTLPWIPLALNVNNFVSSCTRKEKGSCSCLPLLGIISHRPLPSPVPSNGQIFIQFHLTKSPRWKAGFQKCSVPSNTHVNI